MITRWPYACHGNTPDKIGDLCQAGQSRLNLKPRQAGLNEDGSQAEARRGES